MSTGDEPDLPSLRQPEPERRDRVVQILSDRFAAGDIELEDLERRLDLSVRAQTLAELDALVADFREPAAAVKAAATVPVAAPHASRASVAVLSGMEKRGRWVVPARHRGIAVMGGGVLDFREAELTADVTEVRLTAVMGGFQVIVPPDLDVEVHGIGVLGGVSDRTRQRSRPPEGARRLFIRAFAFLGGVDVIVLQPGESERAGNRRLRAERREARRQLRRGG